MERATARVDPHPGGRLRDARTPIRALFVNIGILGHRAVARLISEAVALDPGIEARHLDVSGIQGVGERIVRRLLCARPFSRPTFGSANLDLGRWRQEWHTGLVAARRIRATVARGAFDVIHFHTQATAYASLRRMRTTPSIVSIDITQTLARLEVRPPIARWTYAPNVLHDGAVFRRARFIVSTSQWAADDLAKVYPDCADKVRVLPYPVRLEAADPSWIDERFERSQREGAAPVRVLFMGGDFVRKGGPELLEAWAAAGLAGRAELTLVTDWPIAIDCLPPGVRVQRGLRAYTPAWQTAWRDADLFALPTRGEAFGMVLQEAAAAGLPVVATRLNAIPELVVDGTTGLLVPSGDRAALAAALAALVGSPEQRRAMGAAARRRIERVGDAARYAAALTGLVRAAASRKGAS